MSRRLMGSAVSGSRSSNTRSARFPSRRLPFSPSSKYCQAARMVTAARASTTGIFCSGPSTAPERVSRFMITGRLLLALGDPAVRNEVDVEFTCADTVFRAKAKNIREKRWREIQE